MPSLRSRALGVFGTQGCRDLTPREGDGRFRAWGQKSLEEGLDLPGSQVTTPNWGQMGTKPDCP